MIRRLGVGISEDLRAAHDGAGPEISPLRDGSGSPNAPSVRAQRRSRMIKRRRRKTISKEELLKVLSEGDLFILRDSPFKTEKYSLIYKLYQEGIPGRLLGNLTGISKSSICRIGTVGSNYGLRRWAAITARNQLRSVKLEVVKLKSILSDIEANADHLLAAFAGAKKDSRKYAENQRVKATEESGISGPLTGEK